MFIDSHAHYSHFRFDQTFRRLDYRDGVYTIEETDRDKLIPDLIARGLRALVEPATDLDSNERIYDLSRLYPDIVVPAFGCHPKFVSQAKRTDRKLIESYAARGCAAIGETGLDYSIGRADQHRLRQKIWFIYQIKLAHKLKKPLVLHVRDAHKDALKILKKNKRIISGGVVHCFCGGPAEAEEYLALGFYIGIGGALLREKTARRLSEAVKIIPLEKTVAETDAPYMTPDANIFTSQKQKYKIRNSSTVIGAVIEEIARIKKTGARDVEKTLFENAAKLFSIKV